MLRAFAHMEIAINCHMLVQILVIQPSSNYARI